MNRYIRLFAFLLIVSPIISLAQKPKMILIDRDSQTEIVYSIDTMDAKFKIMANSDSLTFSITMPKRYLKNVDTLVVRILPDSLRNKSRVSYQYHVGAFRLSLWMYGVCIDCSNPNVGIEVVFRAHSDFTEPTTQMDWHENYALTGGVWPRCGIWTDFASPYRTYSPFSHVVFDVYEADICNGDTVSKGVLTESIHQYFDRRGRCRLELRDHMSIGYRYSLSGRLKRELWRDDSCNTVAKIYYRYSSNKIIATYKLILFDEEYRIKTVTMDTIRTVCKNSNHAEVWTRTTRFILDSNESQTILNDNPSLVYQIKYDDKGNVVQEGFLNDSSFTLFQYLYPEQDNDWTRAIQYRQNGDDSIVNMIVERRISSGTKKQKMWL